jgi:hypothetical protein
MLPSQGCCKVINGCMYMHTTYCDAADYLQPAHFIIISSLPHCSSVLSKIVVSSCCVVVSQHHLCGPSPSLPTIATQHNPRPRQAPPQHHYKDLPQYHEERFDLCHVLFIVLKAYVFHQTRNSEWCSGLTPLSYVSKKRKFEPS